MARTTCKNTNGVGSRCKQQDRVSLLPAIIGPYLRAASLIDARPSP
jgi:hypothetical protein